MTATGPGGSVTERSEPIGPIAATAPANIAPPTFGGALEAGSKLTAEPGTWSGTGPFDFSYQWLRCDAAGQNCVEIPGATGETYVLAAGDVGSTIKVRVTAANGAGSASAEAAAAGPVTAAPVDPDEDLSRLPGSLVSREPLPAGAAPGGGLGCGPRDRPDALPRRRDGWHRHRRQPAARRFDQDPRRAAVR